MTDDTRRSDSASLTALAAKLLGDGNAEYSDLAWLERLDSPDILLDDKLFDSLPLDELIRRCDPTKIDRLFKSHMKQQIWKSEQLKAKHPKQQQDDEHKPLPPTPKQQAPTTPTTVASTITSPSGWRQNSAKIKPHASGREGAATTAVVPKANKPSQMKIARNVQLSITTSDRFEETEEGREEPGSVSAAEAEPRQPPASSLTPNKPLRGNLSFVDGSGSLLPPEVPSQTNRDSNLKGSNIPSNPIRLAGPMTTDVQKMISTVEAQLAEKLDVIQSKGQSLSSPKRTFDIGAVTVDKDPGQLSPQRLQTITLAMEEHFAPRFDAIEGMLSGIQHTLAALTTNLAQIQRTNNKSPPQPPMHRQHLSSRSSPCIAAGLTSLPLEKSRIRGKLTKELLNAEKRAGAKQGEAGDLGLRQSGNLASAQSLSDMSNTSELVLNDLLPIPSSCVQDRRSQNLQNKVSRAASWSVVDIETSKNNGLSTLDKMMNTTIVLPTKSPTTSPREAAILPTSVVTNDARDVGQDGGKGNTGNSKIITRAMKIMSKINRTAPATLEMEMPMCPLAERRNIKKFTGTDSPAASNDLVDIDKTKSIRVIHNCTPSSGAEVLHEAVQDSERTHNLYQAHTSLEFEVPTARTLRLRRLQYRPARIPFNTDELIEEPNCLPKHPFGSLTSSTAGNQAFLTSRTVQQQQQQQQNGVETRFFPFHSRSQYSLFADVEHSAQTGAKGAGDELWPFLSSQRQMMSEGSEGTATGTPGFPSKNSQTSKKTDRETQVLPRKRPVAGTKKSPSCNKDRPSPRSLHEQGRSPDLWSDSSIFPIRDVPNTISLVEDQMVQDEFSLLEETCGLPPAKIDLQVPGRNWIEGTPLCTSGADQARSISPREGTRGCSSLGILEGQQVYMMEMAKVSDGLSSHPSDEDDELKAFDSSKDLNHNVSRKPHEEPCCFHEQNEGHGKDRLGDDQVQNKEHSVRSTHSAASNSCLTDELVPIRSNLSKTKSTVSANWSHTQSQDVKILLHNYGGLQPHTYINHNTMEEEGSVAGTYRAIQSLPEYMKSRQPNPLRSSSSLLKNSKIHDATTEYTQVVPSIEDDDDEEANEDDYKDHDYVVDRDNRSFQYYASPANSILAMTSSSHQVLASFPPTTRNLRGVNETGIIMASPTDAKKSFPHPAEILFVQECHLTPGVSTVSHSISTTHSLADRDSVRTPSKAVANVECCSPSSALQRLFQAEAMFEDILNRSSAKERLQATEAKSVAKAKALAGSVVWSNPRHAIAANAGVEADKLVLPNLDKDTLPQSNPAFAIIAQKIAEAEAALKAELARESARPGHFDIQGDDDELSEADEKKNMEIFVPKTFHYKRQTPYSTLRSKSPGSTTTILTDNANRYIELVHMNSAALFDPPSPTASVKSSSSSSDYEITTRNTKVSFLERFKARYEQSEENSNRRNPKGSPGRRESPLATKKVGAQQKHKGCPDARPKFTQQQTMLQRPKSEDKYEVPTASSCSSCSNTLGKTSLEIDLETLDGLQQNDSADANQIFEIVERYYDYHHRFNAGNPDHFTVSLDERKKEPLDQLLTWTMVAFEEIEKDFLSPFRDKTENNQDLGKTLLDRRDNLNEQNINNTGKENNVTVQSTHALANTNHLERVLVGIFDFADSKNDSNSSSSNSTFDDEDDSESTMFTDDDNSQENNGQSISSDA